LRAQAFGRNLSVRQQPILAEPVIPQKAQPI